MDQPDGQGGYTTYYYHADSIGSVVALTDEAGAVVERVKYSPYGQPYFLDAASQFLFDGANNFLNQSLVGNSLLFTAARYDGEVSSRTNSVFTDNTGYYYMRNRYLDADRGRFTARDPVGIWFDGVNFGNGYSYGGSNPVNLVDPLGLNAGMVIAAGAHRAIQALCGSRRMGGRTVVEKGPKFVAGEMLEKYPFMPIPGGRIHRVGAWILDLLGIVKLVKGPKAKAPKPPKTVVDRTPTITEKIEKQMGPRNWTREAIEEAIRTGKQIPAINKATGNPAIRYVHPKTGQSVVVDTTTNQVIHVGGPGFRYGPGSGDL